eukprot:COSAG04_NODE_929_length_9364_cov_4.141932_6_plen_58_part_00
MIDAVIFCWCCREVLCFLVEEALTCDPTRKQLDNILEEQTDVSTLPTQQQIPLGIRL